MTVQIASWLNNLIFLLIGLVAGMVTLRLYQLIREDYKNSESKELENGK